MARTKQTARRVAGPKGQASTLTKNLAKKANSGGKGGKGRKGGKTITGPGGKTVTVAPVRRRRRDKHGCMLVTLIATLTGTNHSGYSKTTPRDKTIPENHRTLNSENAFSEIGTRNCPWL